MPHDADAFRDCGNILGPAGQLEPFLYRIAGVEGPPERPSHFLQRWYKALWDSLLRTRVILQFHIAASWRGLQRVGVSCKLSCLEGAHLRCLLMHRSYIAG